MKILATGGSGFVGSRLIRRLTGDGHQVFAMARSDTSADAVQALGATPVAVDLDAPADIALPSVDAVVHAAAYFRFAGRRDRYFGTNVDGTRALLAAAQNAGATTFVYLSAGAVVMDDRGSALRDVDESAPTYPSSFSAYIASKATAEADVLAADRPGFRALAIRPPAIWGAGDMFSREIPGRVASGQFAFINRGEYPFSTVHVDNVIEAVECALDRGKGGRPYFVADRDTMTFRDFIAGIARIHDVSIDRVRSVPYALAFNVGRIMETGAKLRNSETDPPLSRTMVRMIGRPFTVDDTAARRELGYVGATSRDEGLALASEGITNL